MMKKIILAILITIFGLSASLEAQQPQWMNDYTKTKREKKTCREYSRSLRDNNRWLVKAMENKDNEMVVYRAKRIDSSLKSYRRMCDKYDKGSKLYNMTMRNINSTMTLLFQYTDKHNL